MALLRFSETFTPSGSFAPRTGVVLYFAAVRATADDGDAAVSYPGPGVSVSAALDREDGRETVVDGVVHYVTPRVVVSLLDDPTGLNGGLGVRRGDAFRWSEEPGRLLVATADATRQGSVWRVPCDTSQ